jgi:hypothetical protein
MMYWRTIFVAILSCSLLQTPLSGASSSALGAIVYADRAHLGAANASVGATIFSGDKLRTEPAGGLQIRIGAARMLLSSSTSATLIREDNRPAAIHSTGSAIFSTANSKSFAFHVFAAVIRPSTDLPTIGQLTVLNPREFLVKSIRSSLRIAVEDDVREIPEGAAYRVILAPAVAKPDPQGPRGAGTKGYSGPPKFLRRDRFTWVPISSVVLFVTIWAVHEAFESPDRP